MHSLTPFVLSAAALFAVLAPATPGSACSVPVFRYTLERWEADPYHVVVFHDGAMEASSQAALDVLRAAEAPGRANLEIHPADVGGEMAENLRTLWTEQSAEAPWMVLLYPASKVGDREVWAGPLTKPNAEALVDSPARRTIAERITGGQTAVWVLIEPAGRAEADAAAQLIEKELAEMPERLTLPPELAEAAPHLASRLRIEFSLIRLSRDDPAEAVLLAMLLGSEADLETTYRGERIAIPIYGRGRTLMAMVGRGIVPGNILMGCQFLVSRCTCEIKEQNAGVDLLFDYPWHSSLDVSLVDMVELPVPIDASEASVASVEGSIPSKPVEASRPSALLRNLLITGGFIVLVVALVVLVVLKGTRGKSE